MLNGGALGLETGFRIDGFKQMPDAPINLFVPTFRIDQCLAEIRKCLEVGWTGLGFKTLEFEDAWKE